MIEVREVSKSFGRTRAVQQVSFSLQPGEVTGLLGANGAGKTTTIRMITGFIPSDVGTIRVAGHDVADARGAARREIGYLAESAPVYPEMRAVDFLQFRGRLYGLGRRDRARAIERAARLCELGPVLRRRVGHLSKGFRQRVGLAAAVLHDPKVLVLDEPTNGLDPAQIRGARALIRELSRGRTVLVSSHILPEVERTCDRAIIMSRGRVRLDRPIASLASRGGVIAEVSVDPGGADRAQADLGAAVRGSAERVSAADGWARFRVTGAGAASAAAEAIGRSCAATGRGLRELRIETDGLERAFMAILEGSDEPSDGGTGS